MKPYKSSKYSFDIQTVDGDQAEFEQVLSPWLSSKGLIASQNEYFGYTFYDTSQPITPFPQEFTLCLGEWQNQSSDVIDPPTNFSDVYVFTKTETKDYTLFEDAGTGNIRFVRMNAGEPKHQDVIQLCYDVLFEYGFDPPTEQFVENGKTRVVFRKSSRVKTSKKRKRNLQSEPVFSFTTSASNSCMTLSSIDSLIDRIETKTDRTIVVCLANGESVHVSCNTKGKQTVAIHKPDDS